MAMSALFLLFLAAGGTALASEARVPGIGTRDSELRARDEIEIYGTPSPLISGVHGGFYYRWWAQDAPAGYANYTNGPEGSFSIEWKGSQGSFYGGKGWEVGTNR